LGWQFGDDQVAVLVRSRTRASDEAFEAGPPADEPALIAAARRHPAAFAPLYERYSAPIFRYCMRKVGDPDIANDLTAQTFVKAIERLDRFQQRDGATFRGWLYAIARNTITDRWRRKRPGQLTDAHAAALIDEDPPPEDVAVHRDEFARLLAVLDRLPESQRAIIDLRISGLTTVEIAQVLNVTVPAVKSAQSRAYKRLRDLLEAPEGSTS
jgi:RNA polymerase sigma-70 factor (ECF subfamily)